MPFREDVFGAKHSFERVIRPSFLPHLKRSEAWRAKRYPDGKRADGSIVYSICYGHKEDGDNPPFKITEDMEFTEEEGTAILIKDIERQAHYIDVRVKAPLTTYQFEGLSSLCFQYGLGRLDKTNLFPLLNAENYIDAFDLMLDLTTNTSGKVLKGLRFRRAAEVTHCLTQVN
jgi:GH24 family phage-related lysozyme (muramidase)